MEPRTIVNGRTGERITFLASGEDGDGEFLEIGAFLPPDVDGQFEHVHPAQYETFEVLGGRLGMRIEGKERILDPGETLTVAPGVAHTWWAAGDDPVWGRGTIRPPMGFEPFLATYFSLVNQGKVNDAGRPGLLQTAAWLAAHREDNRPTDVPDPVYGFLTRVLAPIARALGYRSTVEYVPPADPEAVPGADRWAGIEGEEYEPSSVAG